MVLLTLIALGQLLVSVAMLVVLLDLAEREVAGRSAERSIHDLEHQTLAALFAAANNEVIDLPPRDARTP
jgi:hypothetical protein